MNWVLIILIIIINIENYALIIRDDRGIWDYAQYISPYGWLKMHYKWAQKLVKDSSGTGYWCSMETGVGCFNRMDFEGKLKLPWKFEDVGTEMRFYDPLLPYNYSIINWDIRNENIQIKFNSTTQLIFLIHGLRMNADHNNIQMIKDKLYEVLKTQIRVIVVGWGKGALGDPIYENVVDIAAYYNDAAANTRLVGRQIYVLLLNLVKKKGLNPRNIYLIGFSLGAHVAGFAAKDFRDATGLKVGRITALDPANRGFQIYKHYPPDVEPIYVNYNDSDYVDVIHTSASEPTPGAILKKKFGMSIPIGHVDYYPNGGSKQPDLFDCKTRSDFLTGCDHWSAIFYFVSSLDHNTQFKSIGCESFNEFMSNSSCGSINLGEMGYNSIRTSGKNKQFLETSSKFPYSL